MEWLKDVKIGDKVIVEKRRGYCGKSRLSFILMKVKNITKSGKIRFEDNSLFTNGYYIDRRECRHYSTWINCSLLPATEENIENLINRPEIIKYLNNFNFGNIQDTKYLIFLKNMTQLEEERQRC
jgi:hypothetical protein